jgi:hypothetical protein
MCVRCGRTKTFDGCVSFGRERRRGFGEQGGARSKGRARTRARGVLGCGAVVVERAREVACITAKTPTRGDEVSSSA